ncbi:MAG: hypothetical protein RLN88_03720 [Ekhidna sp.]|uniref:hypothetical protein n=1 Tax=Ekhidna sp. TaxID=2608089 RepID=UPI0032EF316D
MDLIREMAHVIEQDRPKSFGLLIPKDSKLKKLYDLALNPLLSERDIEYKIYKSKTGDKRFLMLKGNLINKLSELILIGEHSDINKHNYIKVQFECEKQLTIAKKLLFVNVYHNAEKIIKKVIKQAIRHHLANVEAESYQLMRKINYLKGFPEQTEEYKELAAKRLQVSSKVDEAKGSTELFLAEIKFLRSQSKNIAERCSKYILPLVAYDKDSPFIELAILRLRLIKAHQENDLEEWSHTLTELEGFLRTYPHLLTEHLTLELNVSKVKYYLAVRDHAKADNTLSSLLKFTTFEAFNRYEVLAEQFTLRCHQEKLPQAKRIIEKAYSSIQFEMLDGMDKAAWSIRTAYLHFASYAQGLKLDLKWFPEKNLTTFFNASRPISKDKTGYHFQFVIIRILLLHIRKSIDYASEHNSLKVYQTRHLKSNLPIRSTIFYSFLIKLTKAHFSQAEYQSLTRGFLEKLHEHPVHIEHCEIFTYENLWRMIGETTIKKG